MPAAPGKLQAVDLAKAGLRRTASKGKEMAKFEIYKDAMSEFRWRFHANNGKLLAESGEGYNNRIDCVQEIVLIKQEAVRATISEDANVVSLTLTG